MRTSLRGLPLPESEDEFKQLRAVSPSLIRFLFCVKCDQEFDSKNTRTPAGWAETQITGFCEDCYDEVTKDLE